MSLSTLKQSLLMSLSTLKQSLLMSLSTLKQSLLMSLSILKQSLLMSLSTLKQSLLMSLSILNKCFTHQHFAFQLSRPLIKQVLHLCDILVDADGILQEAEIVIVLH